MTKPIEIIYSQQSSDFIEGRAYSNPRFFSTPRQGVSKVFLVGDWPNIQAAYEARGVPVERLDAGQAVAGPPAAEQRAAPSSLTPLATDRGAVVIPDDWRELNYNRPKLDRDITQRAIAAQLSAEPILNKEQAIQTIEAELARRHAEEVGPNGLTRREMHADLEVADVEIDPALSIEELVAQHAAAKGAA